MINNVNLMSELEITTAALAIGWVKFSYYKADGTKRVAIGTTNRALIDQIRGYSMGAHRENRSFYEDLHGYFDLSRGNWRQFKAERFIGLELKRLSNEDAIKIAITISYADAAKSRNVVDIAAYRNLLSIGEILVGSKFVNEISEIVMCKFDTMETRDFTIRDIDNVISVLHVTAMVEEKPKTNRDALIAELKKLRQREEEILAILLK